MDPNTLSLQRRRANDKSPENLGPLATINEIANVSGRAFLCTTAAGNAQYILAKENLQTAGLCKENVIQAPCIVAGTFLLCHRRCFCSALPARSPLPSPLDLPFPFPSSRPC